MANKWEVTHHSFHPSFQKAFLPLVSSCFMSEQKKKKEISSTDSSISATCSGVWDLNHLQTLLSPDRLKTSSVGHLRVTLLLQGAELKRVCPWIRSSPCPGQRAQKISILWPSLSFLKFYQVSLETRPLIILRSSVLLCFSLSPVINKAITPCLFLTHLG